MILSKILKLPSKLRAMSASVARTDTALEQLLETNHHVQKTLNNIKEGQKLIRSEIDAMKKNITEVNDVAISAKERAEESEHIVRVIQKAKKKGPDSQQAIDAKDVSRHLLAEDHTLDNFYIQLENNFRGSEDEIKKKQKVHLKLFTNSKVDYQKFPIIDLGSGRGEFVELLTENKLNAIGIDLNEQMVKRMNDKGLKCELGDAIEYLEKSDSKSIGGISGFHIAEHIPFETLARLIAEAHRVLVPGGTLLLETPNPENISVGAFTFHYDPSHLKPIPPAIMQFLAKHKGFKKADIIRLAPEMSEKEISNASKNSSIKNLLRRVHGPRDYALVAEK